MKKGKGYEKTAAARASVNMAKMGMKRWPKFKKLF